jgi:Rrf2 family protein
VDAFLSQTAEYAIRATAWLASNSPDLPVRARDLSKGTDIPAHYLAKILRRLVVAGILESQKGQGGGFSLARRPSRISFKDVLLAVDAFPRGDRCAFGWGACDASHPCPLHKSWSEMSKDFQRWASTTTFAQIQHAKPARQRGRRRAARGSR